MLMLTYVIICICIRFSYLATTSVNTLTYLLSLAYS